jgi:hypothetical protein
MVNGVEKMGSQWAAGQELSYSILPAHGLESITMSGSFLHGMMKNEWMEDSRASQWRTGESSRYRLWSISLECSPIVGIVGNHAAVGSRSGERGVSGTESG